MAAETILIPGKTEAYALVIAGVHGTEFSGVEVVRWLWRKLLQKIDKDATDLPHYTTIIIPDLFPKSSKFAESCEQYKIKKGKSPTWTTEDCNVTGGGREYPMGQRGAMFAVPTNRQFPPPGEPLSYLQQKGGPVDPDPAGNRILKDANGTTIGAGMPSLNGTVYLLEVIEKFKPTRIASVHGHHAVTAEYGVDAPGIFVDPRYEYDKTPTKYPQGPTGKQLPWCQIPPLGVGKPDKFGTDSCKFDLGVEPGAPVVGLIVELNDWIESSWTAPTPGDKKSLKDAVDAAANKFNEEKKNKDIHHIKSNTLAQSAKSQAEKFGFKARDLAYASARKKPEGIVDDQLAFAIATEVASRGAGRLVAGNHLNPLPGQRVAVPVVHYAASAGHPDGFSLGDWAPVEVDKTGGGPGDRPGAPVVTVEVYEDNASKAFLVDGTQIVNEDGRTPTRKEYAQLAKQVDPKRCQQLQIYAEALISVFLNPPTGLP